MRAAYLAQDGKERELRVTYNTIISKVKATDGPAEVQATASAIAAELRRSSREGRAAAMVSVCGRVMNRMRPSLHKGE